MMRLTTLLTQLAKNCHHQVSLEQLLSCQSLSVQEAFKKNNSTALRNILADSDVIFPDRDDVAFIDKAAIAS